MLYCVHKENKRAWSGRSFVHLLFMFLINARVRIRASWG